MNTYTTTDYLSAVSREIAKRRVAYPKLLANRLKTWTPQHDLQDHPDHLKSLLAIQHKLLKVVRNKLQGISDTYELYPPDECLRELQRELRLRKQYYPRWVRWGRMSQETADYEIAIWKSLTEYWHTTYCPNTPWRKPPKKRKNKCAICGTLTTKGQYHPVEGWLCINCLPEPQDFTT